MLHLNTNAFGHFDSSILFTFFRSWGLPNKTRCKFYNFIPTRIRPHLPTTQPCLTRDASRATATAVPTPASPTPPGRFALPYRVDTPLQRYNARRGLRATNRLLKTRASHNSGMFSRLNAARTPNVWRITPPIAPLTRSPQHVLREAIPPGQRQLSLLL